MGNAQLKEIDDESEDFVDELKPGTKLMHGQYEIEKFLNAGGFGITYLAKDSLDRKIVIKECFPGAFCRRSKSIVQARSRAHQPELKSIVRLFVQEARSLSKLQHPNIVGVHQVFEDNDTAYMALDFVEGRDLLDTLEDPDHGLNPAQIKSILTDILGAVGFVHDQQMLHRDISPDNILIDENLRPVLIDFGAAREQATKQSRVLSALRVVKDGYSPQEFYIAGSAQDASSDLYALGATFHHLIKGDVPPNAQARLAAIASGDTDPYVPLVDSVDGYDRDFLAAMDMSLQILPKDRVQSAQDWLDMMNGKKVAVVKPTTTAAVAAATDDTPKSKMPMLMASVAVVALLGVVVVTQTDVLGGSEPAEITVPTLTTNEAPAVEEITPLTVAPIVEAEAEPTVTTDDAFGSLEAALAEVESKPAEVEEAVVVSEEVALIAEPTALSKPGVDIPEFDPALVAAAAQNITPLTQDTASAAPEVEEIAPTVVSGLVEASRRPAVRPEGLGEPVLPTPAVTPEIVRDTAETPALPGFLADVQDIPASETPALALPQEPLDITEESVEIALDIPVLVPGNEIVQAAATVQEDAAIVAEEPAQPESLTVLSAWSVDLPFTASETQPDTIGSAAVIAPVWVQEGVVVKAVNGTPVASINEIQNVLRDTVPLGDEAQLNVNFEIEVDGVVSNHGWDMPVRQDVQLLNGVIFTSRNAGDTWVTTVTEIPNSVETELAVGDKLIAYIPTSTPMNARTSLKDLMAREIENGVSQFSFAVRRENSMWVAGLEYNPIPEND